MKRLNLFSKSFYKILLLIFVMFLQGPAVYCQVRAWEGTITIPTYGWQDDVNPKFWALEAGAKGATTVKASITYPYNMQDHLSRKLENVTYKAVYLENSGNTGGYGEAYAELLKSWHDLHTTANSTALGAEYAVADAAITNCPQLPVSGNVTSASFSNGFVIAQEMESFAQRSDVLLSGMNTLSSQIFFETTINTAPTNTYTLDFFAWYDHIMVIDRGIISIKY